MERIMKKLMTVAASLVAIPTIAATATIDAPTIYGKLNRVALYTDNENSNRTSFSGFVDVDSSESRLGAKGKWGVEGIEGTYVLEMGLNSTKGNAGNDYRIRMRQAAIGAKTSFGTFKMGQTYTPLDYVMLKSDPLSSTVASMAGSDTSARIDGAVSGGLGFRYRARTDMFSYETPSMGGLTIALSTDRGNGNDNTPTGNYGDTHYSGLLRYQRKMDKVDLDLYAGYDQWASAATEDSNYTLAGVNLGMGSFKINLGYSIENNDTTAADNEIDRILAGITYMLNKNVFTVTYQNRDEKDLNNDYTQIAAHYRYMFNKNIDFNITYLTYEVDAGATQNDASMAAAGVQLKF